MGVISVQGTGRGSSWTDGENVSGLAGIFLKLCSFKSETTQAVHNSFHSCSHVHTDVYTCSNSCGLPCWVMPISNSLNPSSLPQSATYFPPLHSRLWILRQGMFRAPKVINVAGIIGTLCTRLDAKTLCYMYSHHTIPDKLTENRQKRIF